MTRFTRIVATMIWIAGSFVPGGVVATDSFEEKQSKPSTITLVRSRAPEILTAGARTFLQQRDAVRASVWVFFTDKGMTDISRFDRAAAEVVLTDRARARRVRAGVAHIILADLPIHQPYVDAVVALGATHRRSSRWLNAASFDLPLAMLDDLQALGCVAEIRPLAKFGRRPAELETGRAGRSSQTLGVEDRDYGLSQAQMVQINAITAHNQGYTGQGVTIAMMDAGFGKSHPAFATHLAEGRVLAEYDFVNNDGNTATENGDVPWHTFHGTMTWSVAGGYALGQVIGPAYGANFVLCKTENLDSETSVEEDNWVAALEFADSVGVDVTSTSLTYSDWYTFEDYDGLTAVITQATNMCDSLGIVAVTAMGNEGPDPATIDAPADAFNILAVGAVDASGIIADFSSRGPTSDGRRKPEVCAPGVDVWAAYEPDEDGYRYGHGTSFSTPLVAGAAAVLISARPELTPTMIREALKATASRTDQPDNTYGWGAINLGRALTWPVEFTAGQTSGATPLEVNFVNESALASESLTWEFGDGGVGQGPEPSHVYNVPGIYPVTLTIETALGTFARTMERYVLAHDDTMRIMNVAGVAGGGNRVDIYARNFLPIDKIEIPISWAGALDISLDSFSTAGLRTESFSTQSMVSFDGVNKRATLVLGATGREADPVLEPGDGPVLSLFFYLPYQPGTGTNPVTLIDYHAYHPAFSSGGRDYFPAAESGSLRLGCCFGRVGNVDDPDRDLPSLADVSRLIDHLFINQPPLPCYPEADLNQSGGTTPEASDITIGDLAVLLDRLYISGDSLVLPECL